MYAGCGSYVARLHYVYIVYDVKRSAASMWPDGRWRLAWMVVLRGAFISDFSADWQGKGEEGEDFTVRGRVHLVGILKGRSIEI